MSATGSVPPTILTPRLILRAWAPGDAEPMIAINRDPEITRYLNRPVHEAAVTGFHAAAIEHWVTHGVGLFAIESREPEPERHGVLLGFAGIGYPTFLPELAARPELGWRLGRTAWGRGIATEAVTAAAGDAFGRGGLAQTISIIHPENERSQRVATKQGMTIEGQVHNPVLDRAVDVWTKDAPPA